MALDFPTSPSLNDEYTIDGVTYIWDTYSWNAKTSSATVSGLSDTTITTPADTQVLTYDNATGKWINADASGGGIGSFIDNSIAIASDGLALGNDDGTNNENIALGNSSLSVTTGIRNIALGTQSGSQLSSSSGNSFIGWRAGYNYTLGAENISLGTQSLYGDTTLKGTGHYNLGIGYQTGFSLTTGQYNVLNGYQAGYGLTSGSDNILLGRSAGKAITSGIGNIKLGFEAGLSSNGSSGVTIGYRAGRFASGSNGVYLGQFAGYSEVAHNKLHIANNSTESLIEGDFSARTLQVNGALTYENQAMELISTTTVSASVASVEVTGLSGYDSYRIKVNGITFNTADAYPTFNLSVDNGVSYPTIRYIRNALASTTTSTPAANNTSDNSSTTLPLLTGYTSTSLTPSFSIAIDIDNNSNNPIFGADVGYISQDNIYEQGVATFKGSFETVPNDIVDAIKISASLGNITAGIISIYGVKS